MNVRIGTGRSVTQDTQRGRPPSIRDVARLAGVSHQTVSRVLNAHPSIRESTKQRVLDAMADLQYRPNRAARALVTSRSRTIGVLAAASGSYFGPASSIQAIEDAARESGYYITTSNLRETDRPAIEAALDHLMTQSVEGIVVIAPQTRVFDAITQLSISVPFVTMQAGGGVADHSLWVDQVAGARLATRHLIELGHREMRHVAGPQDWIEAEARLHGFLDETAAWGVASAAPIAGDWTADCGYRAGVEICRMPGVTAVFSSNDQMALGLMHALRDAGRDVPGDVSVIGFDNIPEAAHFSPPLTTVRQDFAELGRRCIRMLLSEIDGTEVPRVATVAPELVVRASTAARRG